MKRKTLYETTIENSAISYYKEGGKLVREIKKNGLTKKKSANCPSIKRIGEYLRSDSYMLGICLAGGAGAALMADEMYNNTHFADLEGVP